MRHGSLKSIRSGSQIESVVSLGESDGLHEERVLAFDESVTGQPSYVLDRVQQTIPELSYTQVEPVQIHLTIRTRTKCDKSVRATAKVCM